jgi:L-ribulokinase
MTDTRKTYVIGIDYGTDSCRAVVTDARDGEEIASAVARYPRWAEGRYCDASRNQFRQHPRDYIDSLIAVMDELSAKTGIKVLPFVRGIAIDTTGSTPCLVTEKGEPLAMLPKFDDDPNAMFMLWKDHTATDEAFEINALAHGWKTDFTMYEGGVYSSEWLWAKLLHVARTAPEVMAAGVSVIEHCDWMPALLTGARSLGEIKRSRCAMGHKAMWHQSFGGYPSDEFLAQLHPELVRIKKTLGTETWTSDTTFGNLSAEWAGRLHLASGLPVAVGAYDAHMGAVGGGVEPGVFIKVMGTSTCDMIVGPAPEGKEHLVKGICGQVDGSIIPGMLGYEAGQSAFGDVYAWFKNLLMWPIEQVMQNDSLPPRLREETERRLMPVLEKAASAIEPKDSGLLALDWLNGRRTPDANQKLKGAIIGLTLGTTAPMIYRALIEATAFGARAIVERFVEENIAIRKIRAIGGVARKSPLVMHIVADVLGKPIEIVANDQSVALGAAMFAAVVAGIYDSVSEAQTAMKPAIEAVILPEPGRAEVYGRLYQDYKKLGSFIEREFP